MLLEIGFDMALTRAQELDYYYKENKKLIGPLHGVPLTMKDQLHIKGLDTSMAYVGWIGTFEGKKGTGKERHVESELVRELHSLGAIPLGKVRMHRCPSCYGCHVVPRLTLHAFQTTLVQSIWVRTARTTHTCLESLSEE